MKQLTQLLKDGKMEIIEVPAPSLQKGTILVKTLFSAISPGTEGKTVSDARLNYIAKARARKKEFLAVLEMAKTQGLWKTYNVVKNKLETPTTLGYSLSGIVIDVDKDINNFKVGDYVACAGLNANHSEIVCVPKNLCVKVANKENLKYAAFVALGSIALQGIRIANCSLGENVLIIGLGTIGLLTIQLLNINGCNVYGIDIDEWAVKKGMENGAKAAFVRSQPGLQKTLIELTNGIGFDSVIITAGANTNDPVNLAGSLCRKKGNVVIVGAVPTNFERENYYKKELRLLMSTSYGPGRYDSLYEEKGIDYPIGYVRWTENRNMQAFIDFIENKKINLEKIITHEFHFEQSPQAYNLIVNKTEKFSGIVLKYSQEAQSISNTITLSKSIKNISNINVGFIGAGTFAQNNLLPYLKNKCNLITVVNLHGNTAYYVAKKFSFKNASTDQNSVLNDKEINTVFIATRHNLHAPLVISSLEKGKHVFVEKPLCLNLNELEKIKELYNKTDGISLMVGYNRRFAPFSLKIREHLTPEQKKAINIRVNAGYIPPDHWIQDPEIGGGRIVGEVCHFVDLAIFFTQSKVKSLYANLLNDSQGLNDTLIVSLSFENGSIANIAYFSNGNKKIPKEYIEVFADGNTFIIDDFKTLIIAKENKINKTKKLNQDKGHKDEVKSFIESLENGKILIPFDELYNSTKATLLILESLKLNKVINL
jgi:polar amino acid transport system substrate-binding protein